MSVDPGSAGELKTDVKTATASQIQRGASSLNKLSADEADALFVRWIEWFRWWLIHGVKLDSFTGHTAVAAPAEAKDVGSGINCIRGARVKKEGSDAHRISVFLLLLSAFHSWTVQR